MPKEKKCKGSTKKIGTCCAPTKCKSGYGYVDSDDGGGSCYSQKQIAIKTAACSADGKDIMNECTCSTAYPGKYMCQLECRGDQ